jgi:hypothetical protein
MIFFRYRLWKSHFYQSLSDFGDVKRETIKYFYFKCILYCFSIYEAINVMGNDEFIIRKQNVIFAF